MIGVVCTVDVDIITRDFGIATWAIVEYTHRAKRLERHDSCLPYSDDQPGRVHSRVKAMVANVGYGG